MKTRKKKEFLCDGCKWHYIEWRYTEESSGLKDICVNEELTEEEHNKHIIDDMGICPFYSAIELFGE